MTQRQDQANALGVITQDPKIRAWLAANDPNALAQCEKALQPQWDQARPIRTTQSTHVALITLTGGEEVEIRRLEDGVLVGFDGAYLDRLGPGEDPMSPYTADVIVVIPDDEEGGATCFDLTKPCQGAAKCNDPASSICDLPQKLDQPEKNLYFRPECGSECRIGQEYGPYEYVQLTYNSLRVSPDGDFGMNLDDDNRWTFAEDPDGFLAADDDKAQWWSDVVIYAKTAGASTTPTPLNPPHTKKETTSG